MEDQPPQEPYTRTASTYTAVGNGRRKKIIFSLVVIGLLILSVGLAWFFLGSGQGEGEATPTPFNEEPTPFPTPTIVEINRQDLRVRIMNGSGIAGEASYLRDELTKLGYTEMEVGNAATQDATATNVTFSAGTADDVIDEITTKLNELYQSVNVTSGTGDYDIDIVVGLRKGQARATLTPTPRATLTPTQAATEDLTVTPTAAASATPTP